MRLDTRQIMYGNAPVPWTASWSAEEAVFLSVCPYAERIALCMPEKRGEGRPLFGSPHACRQRACIALGLCDLCGKPLKGNTKVSLSQARPILHAVNPGDILQVEPMVHRECAAICMRHCPSLRKQRTAGELRIRQVFQWRCQFAIYSAQGVFEACGERRQAVAHAKVQLVKWRERDEEWLL